MPHRRRLVLDCPYFAWRHQRLQETAATAPSAPSTAATLVLPFSFSHVPSALAGGERPVILKPYGGKKS